MRVGVYLIPVDCARSGVPHARFRRLDLGSRMDRVNWMTHPSASCVRSKVREFLTRLKGLG